MCQNTVFNMFFWCVGMCECVFVGMFCVCVIPTICFKLVLYKWCVIGRYKNGDLCNPDFFWVFFIMWPSCMSIILILLVSFNCMYRGFLDLVWLWCLICGLEHEFVGFNKPYLCFFVLLMAEWCWRLWVCPAFF